MTLPSSGSSEEDLTQYADSFISQAEITQDRPSSEVLTAVDVTTNVLQTEVNDPQPTTSGVESPATSDTAI